MAKLTPVVIDYETFWSTDHSLTKMNPIDYVMHEETEIISAAIKHGNDLTQVFFGEQNIRKALSLIDWSDKIVISHNNEGFDSMVSAWRFGIKPKMWGCTLAMARPIHAKQAGGSLKALVEHYKIGVKDNTALVQTKGKHLHDFTQQELAAMREYNRDDTDQCRKLFDILLPLTSKDEMRLIDMTIRMLVEPQFDVDRELLRKVLAEERQRKRDALLMLAAQLAVDGLDNDEIEENVRARLASANKFAAFLESRGVAAPTKISPTTGKDTYALAKTDEAFVALKEHSDPVVAAAARARLDVKSTLLETRIEAFLAASSAAGGRLPVTLKYYGADTTGRWSGWGYNPQNLPRVSGKPSDCLRNSLRAPKGFKVVVADLSGIELRVNMFLWKVPYAVELFNASPDKADLYKALAAELFNKPVDQIEKNERQMGKALHLGCGFGLGTPSKFVTVCKTMTGLEITPEEAKGYIDGYRAAHPEIVKGWRDCHKALDYVYRSSSQNVLDHNENTNWTKFYSLAPDVRIQRAGPTQIDPWGLCFTCEEGIRTPKGVIRYPNLRQEVNDEGKKEWFYGEGRNKARIYAGKVTENIVQHLARNVIADNALAFRREYGYSPALMVHDELVYVVEEDGAEAALAGLQKIMRTPPVWWPELITWSDGDVADTYGEAK